MLCRRGHLYMNNLHTDYSAFDGRTHSAISSIYSFSFGVAWRGVFLFVSCMCRLIKMTQLPKDERKIRCAAANTWYCRCWCCCCCWFCHRSHTHTHENQIIVFLCIFVWISILVYLRNGKTVIQFLVEQIKCRATILFRTKWMRETFVCFVAFLISFSVGRVSYSWLIIKHVVLLLSLFYSFTK